MAQNNISIKLLPKEERPRERLMLYGASSLSLSELISILISRGAPDEPVNILSQKIVSKFGSVQEISRATLQELTSIKGIGNAKACQLIASFEIGKRVFFNFSGLSDTYDTTEKVYNLIKPYLANRVQEHFLIVSLDARNKLISVDIISVGTINQSLVHPREVFKAAITRRAASMIIAHNHPSNDPRPSDDDINVTKRLFQVAKTVGIPILDHMIVSDSGYISMKDKQILDNLV